MNKDVRDMKRYAEQLGFAWVAPRKGGHIKVYDDGRLVTTVSCTPSDGRALKNVKSQLDRAVRNRTHVQLEPEASTPGVHAPACVRGGDRRRGAVEAA